MSARDAILAKIRSSLKTTENDETRRLAVGERLRSASPGIIPARGQLPPGQRVELFCAAAEALYARVTRLRKMDEVPRAVAAYLRETNLPAAIRMGDDPRLAEMPWGKQRALEIRRGPSDGYDEAGVSHAFAAIAETGTIVMLSGPENPTTINFLPEHHIVVVDAEAIQGDLETVLAAIRADYGKGNMPRTVNLISGPSRSGDIEQKLVLGAHGPRALHLIVVGE